jgi:hypothetical protein
MFAMLFLENNVIISMLFLVNDVIMLAMLFLSDSMILVSLTSLNNGCFLGGSWGVSVDSHPRGGLRGLGTRHGLHAGGRGGREEELQDHGPDARLRTVPGTQR